MFQRLSQIAFFAGAIAPLYLSLHPRPPQAITGSADDLVLHFGTYFVLGLTGALGWPSRIRSMLIVLPLVGFAVELLQIPVPGRAFEWVDMAANTLGAATGVIVAGLMMMLRRRF